MKHEFKVSTGELVEECVSLLGNFQPNVDGKNVVQYLAQSGINAENHHVSDFWGTRVLRTAWRQFHFIDVDNTFWQFDSKWHNYVKDHWNNANSGKKCPSKCRNQHRVMHTDSSKVVLGTQINYFFQGALHYIFGFTWDRTLARCQRYKDVIKPIVMTYNPLKVNVLGESYLTADDTYFLELGYSQGSRCLQSAYHQQMRWDVKVTKKLGKR